MIGIVWQNWLDDNKSKFIGGHADVFRFPEGRLWGEILDIAIVGNELVITTVSTTQMPVDFFVPEFTGESFPFSPEDGSDPTVFRFRIAIDDRQAMSPPQLREHDIVQFTYMPDRMSEDNGDNMYVTLTPRGIVPRPQIP